MKLLRLGLIFISFFFLFVACQQSSKSSEHNHGQHTGTQVEASGFEGTWPPQPSNMSKIGIVAGNFAPQNSTSSKSLQNAEITSAILSDADVNSALGDDYALLDVNISKDKAGNSIPEATFFSYSNNVTVEATLTRDRRVLHTVSAAEDYQFPESQEDINRSITLARASLIEQGYAGAATLNAHSMLTFPKRDAEKSFYDVRMLYVTVGNGNGTEPVYAAWVDLTNNQVVESGPIRSYEEGQDVTNN